MVEAITSARNDVFVFCNIVIYIRKYCLQVYNDLKQFIMRPNIELLGAGST